MADDIGAKELACYGNAQHKTPRLDKMATPACGSLMRMARPKE